MNKKLLLSFALAAAMTGCINDADVPSGNGDNPAPGARGGNMEISFVVPNSSNGSRAASAEDSGIYEDGTAEEYKVSNVTLYLVKTLHPYLSPKDGNEVFKNDVIMKIVIGAYN